MLRKADTWFELVLKMVGIVIVGTLTVFVMALISPLLFAVGEYFTGWVLYKVFPFAGIWIANGFTRLGIEMAPSSLPFVLAAIGCVGPYFKATLTTKSK